MKAIFFDTNFFYQNNKPTKSYFSTFREKGFDCFVPRMVVNEVKAQNRRDIAKAINSLTSIASGRLSILYFPLDDFIESLDMESIYSESDSKVEHYFVDLFGDQIIENAPKEEIMDTLFNRDAEKRPPFKAEASDKGWKDTIIWTSLIRFCKNNKVEEVFFVTKDGFDKQEKSMIDEFVQEVGIPITFLKETPETLQAYFKIEEENNCEEQLENNEPELIVDAKSNVMDSKAIERIKRVIRNFTVSEVAYNAFGDYNLEPNFVFHEYLNDSKVEIFCDEMLKDKELYIFHDYVDLDKYLKKAEINGYNTYAISVSAFNDFVSAWNDIKNVYPSYKDQFLKRLIDELNSQYREKKDSEEMSDDLPF